jgi:hypothetical protein
MGRRLGGIAHIFHKFNPENTIINCLVSHVETITEQLCIYAANSITVTSLFPKHISHLVKGFLNIFMNKFGALSFLSPAA